MLREIYCDKFHQKKIEFNPGLSVVLGTNSGENSIGKSTFLLIVDFVFGGSTYSESTDILKNVGAHDIFFSFEFDGADYYFCRNSNDPHNVWECNDQYEKTGKLDLQTYCNWLDSKYSIQLPGLNFRDCVGRYIRVYGKKNCLENQPLHYTPVEPADKAIFAFIKLFGKYGLLQDLETRAKDSEETLKVYRKAAKHDFVAHISKKKYRENEKRIREIDTDLEALATGIESGLTDINAIQSENAIHIKELRSYACRVRGRLISKSKVLSENGTYKFPATTHDFSTLLEYFPNVNIAKIEEIEHFHEQIGKIFKSELQREKKRIAEEISDYDTMIAEYDAQLKDLIQNPKISKALLRRHSDLLSERDCREKENKSYDEQQRLKENSDNDHATLMQAKQQILGEISGAMNKKMDELNDTIYSGTYHAPIVSFSDKNYSFHTPDDTGTGIAYKGLIVFDLAVLNLTSLPVLVHDSVILKQISDDAIEHIIHLYAHCGKQVIIAFDKQSSYTSQTEKILTQNSVLKLSRGGHELFGRSWG